MKKKSVSYKILEIKKKNINKKTLEKIFYLIKKENTYSILSKLDRKLIYEYLTISASSKKIYLFVMKSKQEIVGYILYVKSEKELILEFKRMKFKIIKHLLLKLKFFSIINILLAISKLDILLANFTFKKDSPGTINLNLLAIKKEYQSKGLGKLLIKKSLKNLLSQGLKLNYISCEAPTSRALKFYQRNKFILLGKKIRLFKNLFLLKKKINEF